MDPHKSLKSDKPCPGCDATNFPISYSGAEGKRMAETGECFICAFWELKALENHDIVIDNRLYGIGPEPGPNTNRSHLGMSGRRFDIEFFNTGKRYTTHNLWSGGEIPEKYRDRIPNTARFVNGAESAQVGQTTCWNPSNEKELIYPPYKSEPSL